MPSERPHIGQSSLFKNSLLNLIGMVLPAFVALLAIPLCIRTYGEEQFGLLSLAWTFLVSSTFLDLGMGISATKHSAEALRAGRSHDLPVIVWSSLAINMIAGGILALIISLVAPTIADALLGRLHSLRDDSITIIIFVAGSIPFITCAAVLRGVLESSNRFDLTNAVKVPSSSLLFLIPALGALFSLPLLDVVLLLALSRVLTALAFLFLVVWLYPEVLSSISVSFTQATSLFKFGRWVGLSSILNPVMNQGEKIIIPAMLSVGTLTYYSAPHEMVARLAAIPFSLAIALLPKLSFLGKEEVALLKEQVILRPVKYLAVIITPLVAIFVYFSQEILTVWLGKTFVVASSDLLMVLAFAYFFNAFTYIGFSAVQGLGHPEKKAKLDFVLAPLFIVLCWLLIQRFGLLGAALAKFLIFTTEAICLFWLLKNILSLRMVHLFPIGLRLFLTGSGGILVLGVLLHALGASLVVRGASFVLSSIFLAILWWGYAVSSDEKLTLRSNLVKLRTLAGDRPISLDEQG